MEILRRGNRSEGSGILSLSCESSFPRKHSFWDRSLAFIVGQESPIKVESIEWCFESLRILLHTSAWDRSRRFREASSMIQFSAPYSKVGTTQDSTISLAERGLKYPRKHPDEPKAKNYFLALLMLLLNAKFCWYSVVDHGKPRQLAWGSVGTLQLMSERCSGVDL